MDINLTLIAQSIVFLVFILFTAKFVWPPLMKAVSDRQNRIADGLAAAEKGSKSLADASAKSEETLRAARAQAQDILAGANKQATQLVDQAKVQAKTEGDRIVAAAHDEVKREVARAREDLRKQVGELAVLGAAKILKREVNAQAHADVLADLAARV
ncbi:MAG: synthase, subunit b [Panacagrimonas sp.]|jgi:F-type H+-transporting ATPase subunit b|nr:F0F1 ATP synthase subunit B [Panacagrimonas sp.]MCC2658135.1 synthase, subunit b [Panacagrimonas sp.]